MPYDALAMHAVTTALRNRTEGGRIDRAVLLTARSVALEIFAKSTRPWIIFDLAPDASRVFLSEERARRMSDAVTPFSLLLRKYVAGSRIVSVEQPRLERVLRLRLSARVDHGIPRDIELVAEVMGRRTNLVLIDEDGTIMDALIRVPPAVNPSRPLLPHLRYTAPPGESKLNPEDPALAQTLRRAGQLEGPGWRLIVQKVAGFSPLAAREVVARATGNPETPASDVQEWDSIAAAVRELLAPLGTGEWAPTVARRDGVVLDYAPYHLTQFPDADVEWYPTMSRALIEAGMRGVSGPAFERLKRPLLNALGSRLEQARRKRASLERSLASAESADELREAGEAILASAHAIQRGAPSLTWEGRRIDLYPSLSPAENAQSYFERYTSARDAKTNVPPLLEHVAGEIEHLEGMAVHVDLADSEKAINALRRELEEAGILRPALGKKKAGRRATTKATAPSSGIHTRIRLEDGDVFVGGSAEGNDWLTFHHAQPEDLWLHARGVPGAHVILRSESGEPTDAMLEMAAGIAAAKSAARDAGSVEVDYTLRKYVRKIRGGAAGRVTYRNERTIAVEPWLPDLDAAGELLPELGLGHVANDTVDFLTPFEEDHGRNAGDVEAPGDRRVGINVDLRDL